ncbi:histidine kinase [Nonomuraea roseoviolacea]|uniref:Signal transduction histidine kinase n=1 Tax=Nonomuraea roseoviolacea subsp. carminata TaxID=160689 RepID=A0ABT1KFD1_9ACTN|nr:histidine kinase [Nonomuraea roseoviolacea]MCP2352675.1 signal transduction histidine kinase [Nonomuraea roseoviolacea subsp. carminata]
MARDLLPPRRFTVPLLGSIGVWCLYKITGAAPGKPLTQWPPVGQIALGTAAILLMGALMVAIVLRRLPRHTSLYAVLTQALLAYGLPVMLGAQWGPYAALSVASALLVLTGRTSWLLAAGLALGEGLIKMLLGLGWQLSAWTVIASGTTGCAFFAVARLTQLAQDLQRARAEAAGLEVARERLRIARGLGAALGGSLAEVLVALRRSAADLDGERLAHATRTARAALAEVRSVADDFRDRSLAAEIEAARTVLGAAGTRVTVRAAPLALPSAIDAALAAVLRRTVVAVLRRGTPEHCRIQADGSARLRVTFSGPPPAAPLGELRSGSTGGTPGSSDGDLAGSVGGVTGGSSGGNPGGSTGGLAGASGGGAGGSPGAWTEGMAEALREAAAEVGDLGGRLDVGSEIEARIPVRQGRGRARSPRPAEAAPWLAFAVLLLIELDHLGSAALDLRYSAYYGIGSLTLAQVWAAAVLLPSLALLQLRHVFPRPGGEPPRAWKVTVPLQVALLLTALVVVGQAIPPSYAALVGAVVLYHVRPPWSWITAASVLVAPVAIAWSSKPWDSQVNALVGGAMFIGPVYALCGLPVVVARLEEARQETTRLAVVKERLRIARDVHDLLGFQLSALVLKGELAGRLLAVDPGKGRAQLAELATLAERALASLRSITREPAGLRLDEEVAAARSMLAAAGIEARVDLAVPVPPGLGGVLAVVLREAVTNVVRHSRAGVCSIEASRDGDTYRLRVTNDGVRAGDEEAGGAGWRSGSAQDSQDGEPGGVRWRSGSAHGCRDGERSGTGLANLRARAEEVGGRLLVRDGTDEFGLTVEVPAAVGVERAGAPTAA